MAHQACVGVLRGLQARSGQCLPSSERRKCQLTRRPAHGRREFVQSPFHSQGSVGPALCGHWPGLWGHSRKVADTGSGPVGAGVRRHLDSDREGCVCEVLQEEVLCREIKQEEGL